MNNNINNAPAPLVSDLVLIGGGHAHVHVLKMLGMPTGREFVYTQGLQVTLICRDVHTPYSGMLPGYCAGQYHFDDIHLDLVKLCRFSNVRLIHAAATKITYNDNGGGGGHVSTDDGRPPVRYDALSIDIGSAPSGLPLEYVVPVKPIAHFARQYEAMLQRLSLHIGRKYTPEYPFQLIVVGGGAGGVELALSVQVKLWAICSQRQVAHDAIQVSIATRGAVLVPNHNHGVRRILTRILTERNICVKYQAEGVQVVPLPVTNGITDEQTSQHHYHASRKKKLVLSETSKSQPDIVFDECLWCTSAGAPAWMMDHTPFATTPDGFLLVSSTYECIQNPGVFAVGDCCHMVDHPRPKAGVFAVRAGPPLTDNLLRFITRQALAPHYPQTQILGLISTGNEYAIASKGNWFATEGKWVWTWKDYIDRKWMKKYSSDLPDLEQMMAKMKFPHRYQHTIPNLGLSKGRDVVAAFNAETMRCGGCGAKVGATTVARVLRAIHERQTQRDSLEQLPIPAIDHDDAAIVLLPTPGAMVHTIDYFRSFVSDPFLFGKVAAVHALSDVHAMGATAQTALALAVVPFCADEDMTEATLLDVLAGASDILQEENVQLIGGHTCEGSELACGFAIQGFTEVPDQLLRKKGGKPGDKIVITKAIGTGALFAADMRAKCKGAHVVEALQTMVQSNGGASRIALEIGGIHACTDVTGFGLVGHLLEMLMANNDESIGARLNLRTIPFLQGGLEASSLQIYSSLQPSNARNRRAIMNHLDTATACPIKYPLLFDPQTAGGLLFFVDPSVCDAFVTSLKDEYPATSVIGMIYEYTGACDNGLCTIGSGSAQTGERIQIDF